ncbi:hypothetical protein ACEWY4_000332 [Coilia grayii]|uniref:Peptidase A1 domain-containing protein n=1 Tax=Coilia grayii TaxID=363190 RepID=A0ABD1KWB6_9TELE
MATPTEDYYNLHHYFDLLSPNNDHEAYEYDIFDGDGFRHEIEGASGIDYGYRDEAFPNPQIRVAKWMDSDEDVIVGCFHDVHQKGHFVLAVDTGTNITLIDSGVPTRAGRMFNISVTPPVTFTCMLHTTYSGLLSSENYTLSQYGSESPMPSVSLSYKLFAGCTGIVLIAMSLVVIAVTLRGKRTAGPDKTTETNIYEETIIV